MLQPIKDFICKKYPDGSVMQWFGENPTDYAQFDLAGHNGIDIVAPYGTPLLAVKDGWVWKMKTDDAGYGKNVRLICPQPNGDFEEWIYGHCSSFSCVEGQQVKAGDTIALMGNSGFVVSGPTPYWKYNPYAGTHLHLGKRIWKEVATGYSEIWQGHKLECQNYSNGYKGSIDFRAELDPTMPVEPPILPVDASTTQKTIQIQLTLIGALNQLAGLYQRLINLYK